MEEIAVIWLDELPGNSPALSSPERFEIYLSRKRLGDIPSSWLTFIINHEKAHLLFNTDDELICDCWAFYKSASQGIGCRDLVQAITRVLDYDTVIPEELNINWLRFEKQKERALEYEKNFKK